ALHYPRGCSPCLASIARDNDFQETAVVNLVNWLGLCPTRNPRIVAAIGHLAPTAKVRGILKSVDAGRFNQQWTTPANAVISRRNQVDIILAIGPCRSCVHGHDFPAVIRSEF